MSKKFLTPVLAYEFEPASSEVFADVDTMIKQL